MRTGPERTCLGCRRVRPKRELVRLVRGSGGRVMVDADGRGPGRGAYVCPDDACLRKALSRGRLGHAFREASEPPAEGPEAILQSRA